LRFIERLETLPNERPIYEIRISDCGTIDEQGLPDEMLLPDYPEDYQKPLFV